MKKTSKILPFLLAALTCAAMLVSCDYWNDDWYKSGDSENAPLIGSTSNRNGSSSSSRSSSGTGTSSGSGSGSSGGDNRECHDRRQLDRDFWEFHHFISVDRYGEYSYHK